MEETAATAASLPNDVLREILARVKDAASLFRCATTCKRWRCLVADPSFLRRLWPEDACHRSSSFLSGFMTQRRALFPTPPSVFGPAGRRLFLRSFLPHAANLLKRAAPLISRRARQPPTP